MIGSNVPKVFGLFDITSEIEEHTFRKLLILSIVNCLQMKKKMGRRLGNEYVLLLWSGQSLGV